MADLAQERGRATSVRRLTTNRGSILPERRNTEQPNRQVFADMRNANVGDGGAGDLRRALSQIPGVVGQAWQAKIAADAPKRLAEAQQGAQDALAGQEASPEMQKAQAYQEAYYRISNREQLLTFRNATKQRVDEAVNSGATVEEIETLLHDNVSQFLTEQSETLPGEVQLARRDTYAGLSGMMAELRTEVGTKITERVQNQTLESAQNTWAAQWDEDADVDYDGDLLELSKVVGMERARETLLTAATARALNPEAPSPETLQAILDARQADGKTPILDAAGQIRAANAINQAAGMAEALEKRQQKERVEDLTYQMTLDVLDGKDVSTTLEAAVRERVLTPEEGNHVFSVATRARSGIEGGYANTANVLAVHRKIAEGKTVTLAEIRQMEQRGDFGYGTDAAQAVVQLMNSVTAAARAARAEARASAGNGEGGTSYMSASSVRTRETTTARNFLWGQYPDSMTDPSSGRPLDQLRMIQIDREFNALVHRGVRPLEAAQQLITKNPPGAASRLGGGFSARTTTPTRTPVAGARNQRSFTLDGELH